MGQRPHQRSFVAAFVAQPLTTAAFGLQQSFDRIMSDRGTCRRTIPHQHWLSAHGHPTFIYRQHRPWCLHH